MVASRVQRIRGARGRGAPPKRVKPEEIDFGSPETLVRLALVARLDSLEDSRGAQLTRGTIARDLHIAGPDLSKRLRPESLIKDGADEVLARAA